MPLLHLRLRHYRLSVRLDGMNECWYVTQDGRRGEAIHEDWQVGMQLAREIAEAKNRS